MITSTFAATMRRPSSRKPSLMRLFCSGGTLSHSRTMSGPWLAAKAPTRLAIQPPDEFIVLHAHGEEVVAQQIGVGALGEKRRIVLRDRLLHALIERIAREHGGLVGTELGLQCRRLQVEEELREPVVAHLAFKKLFPVFLGSRAQRVVLGLDERLAGKNLLGHLRDVAD